MDFTKTHIVVLIVTISILFAPTTNAVGGLVKAIRSPQARVYSICKPTTYPTLCFKTILPKALVTPKFNIYKAVEVELQAAIVQINKTVAIIKTLLPKFENDKNMFYILTICGEEYGYMADGVTEMVRRIALRNATEARYKMDEVYSNYILCNDAFDPKINGGEKVVVPFAADHELATRLVYNCFDIIASIVDKKVKAGKAPLA